VSPVDALVVINALNQAESNLAWSHLDVNGDNHLSPIDALLVINAINAAATVQSPVALARDATSAALAGVREPDERQTDSVISDISLCDPLAETCNNGGNTPVPGAVAYADDFEDVLAVIAADIATTADTEDGLLDDLFGELGDSTEDIR
jgi:hypothetical protein